MSSLTLTAVSRHLPNTASFTALANLNRNTLHPCQLTAAAVTAKPQHHRFCPLYHHHPQTELTMKLTVLEKLFSENPSLDDIIRDTIDKRKNEDAFYVCDVNDILRKHKTWLLKLPRVRPFYAVKCNSSPIVLEILASLGIGFDCASKVSISE